MRHRLSVVAALLVAANAPAQQPAPQPAFTFQEVMIPVRDGVHLQTAILTPTDKTGSLPILFRRTPYGVPDQPLARVPPSWQALAQDGYIFVIQNLRGRFKSEGVFRLTSQVDLTDSTSTNETTDAYDSIDWLVKHVPNNGNVGMFGVSYDGLTTALALLHPHPALKAISEQAAPVDQWMNDDMHRYGALRESYAFEYSVLEQADKNKNTNFAFETYDTYAWYLALGPLSNIDARYVHGSIPFWTEVVTHPDYDAFWKKEAWISQLHASTVPNLNVAGFWDQEDPWGPWQIFRHAAEHDPDHTNFMVAGPWYHGEWHAPKGDSIGLIAPGGDWRTWEVQDQRFVDGRPDVLTFVSAPLEHDLTITGEVAADLFASTSGSDADFVVKLIDVYPENAQPNGWDPDAGPAPGEYARSMNGYELPIAMEVRRGRYNQTFEHPRALPANKPVEWRIPLRDHDHVFLKGHRLMVQVQSTWFPLIDRNPQKFVPSIYQATAADYVKATHRLYCSAALPSHIVLPVVP